MKMTANGTCQVCADLTKDIFAVPKRVVDEIKEEDPIDLVLVSGIAVGIGAAVALGVRHRK